MPDLSPHYAYWSTYDPRFPGDLVNIPSAPIAGPFAPQPVGYDPTLTYGSDAGPPAGTFQASADGESYYQLLVLAGGCTRPGPSCQTRLNGFQLELQDVTPPELTCADHTITTDQCATLATWCEPEAIRDNCPLPNPGSDMTPIWQLSGPDKVPHFSLSCCFYSHCFLLGV